MGGGSQDEVFTIHPVSITGIRVGGERGRRGRSCQEVRDFGGFLITQEILLHCTLLDLATAKRPLTRQAVGAGTANSRTESNGTVPVARKRPLGVRRREQVLGLGSLDGNGLRHWRWGGRCWRSGVPTRFPSLWLRATASGQQARDSSTKGECGLASRAGIRPHLPASSDELARIRRGRNKPYSVTLER